MINLKDKEIKDEIDRLLGYHSIDYLLQRLEEPDQSSLFVYVRQDPKGLGFSDSVDRGFTTISDVIDYIQGLKNRIIIEDICKELGRKVFTSLITGIFSRKEYLDWNSYQHESPIKVKRSYDRPIKPIKDTYFLSFTDHKTDTCISLDEIVEILAEISIKDPQFTGTVTYLPVGTTVEFPNDLDFIDKIRNKLKYFQDTLTIFETEIDKGEQMDSVICLNSMQILKELL